MLVLSLIWLDSLTVLILAALLLLWGGVLLRRYLWRSRWLFLLLFLITSFTTPGVYVCPTLAHPWGMSWSIVLDRLGRSAGLLGLLLALLPGMARWRGLVWHGRVIFLLLLPLAVAQWPAAGSCALLGDWSPTREGLLLALQQAARMVVVLGGLALAFQGLAAGQRLVALLGLLRPLQRVGLPVERLAVRLHLTLEVLEREPPPKSWGQWLFHWHRAQQDEEITPLELDLPPWRQRDWWIMGLSVAGVVICVGL